MGGGREKRLPNAERQKPPEKTRCRLRSRVMGGGGEKCLPNAEDQDSPEKTCCRLRALPQWTQGLGDLVSDSDSNFGGSILDEGPVALPGSLFPAPSQALSLFPSSSLGGKRQRKGRGFGWDTPPNKRHSTAEKMEEEKEEGGVIEKEYVYSVKEEEMVPASTKRTPEEQKK
uniref:Uncharacterized protein n=1 Tax=Chromera velia CCMP2878 TaxID=1169474 RepID=A0A0G4I6I1_9ALVE|eukprot:Cvel_11373.t1-p1 / transcript=Cvel_11373.t1 / gene=Cvel_11373 / organism=Chromera_velia_CCMP2878 / gene_product=hypothetical protein / transcript_product=hypothetical protein / location=Cvel_scaffold713:14624-17488(+) / protein_length=171 / sequence_SO=supercontig / SO=protein_coding / is_pseudo=false